MTDSSGDHPSLRRAPTQVKGLDTVLGGGFMVGGIYIVRGSTGAGKTILTNQFCFNHASGGGRAIVVTILAEDHARIFSNLRQFSFFDERAVPDRVTYLSAFSEMRDGGLNQVVKLLRREVRRHRADLLVVDGLITSSLKSDTEFEQFVHDLQEMALAADCVTFLVTSGSQDVSPADIVVDGVIKMTDRDYGWQAQFDLQISKFRGGPVLRGRHSYVIGDDGVVVYPRIEALLAHPSGMGGANTNRATTGLERLNAMVDGGFPCSSTTMLIGPSGSGKTTLGLHFLAASTPAEPGLMFSFYETPPRLALKAERLAPDRLPFFDGDIVDIQWQTPTSDLLDAYGERLLEGVRRRKVKRLFIDGLSAFKNGAIDPSRIGNFFSALANELRVMGVTTLYSLEVPDLLGPAVEVPVEDVANLAENMILLRFVEKRSRLYRLLSILEVRDSDFDPSLHEFRITDRGIEIADDPSSAETILLDSPAAATGRDSRIRVQAPRIPPNEA